MDSSTKKAGQFRVAQHNDSEVLLKSVSCIDDDETLSSWEVAVVWSDETRGNEVKEKSTATPEATGLHTESAKVHTARTSCSRSIPCTVLWQ